MASEDPLETSFPKTSWSLVGRAGGPASEVSRAATSELVARYLPALRAHLVLARRVPTDEADDLLQEFLASKVLEKGLFGRAEQAKGKFRTFLLTALGNFLVDHKRAARARKRSAGGLVPIDSDASPEPTDERVEEPSAAFEAEWARQIMDRAATLMRQQCEQEGRPDLWTVFEARLWAPSRDGSPPVEYDALVATLRAGSVEQVSNLLVTAKRAFNRSLRAAVEEYAGPGQVDQEIFELRDALGRASPR